MREIQELYQVCTHVCKCVLEYSLPYLFVKYIWKFHVIVSVKNKQNIVNGSISQFYLLMSGVLFASKQMIVYKRFREWSAYPILTEKHHKRKYARRSEHTCLVVTSLLMGLWSIGDSNSLPFRCERNALPDELMPQMRLQRYYKWLEYASILCDFP